MVPKVEGEDQEYDAAESTLESVQETWAMIEAADDTQAGWHWADFP